jgi:hypothetical protein
MREKMNKTQGKRKKNSLIHRGRRRYAGSGTNEGKRRKKKGKGKKGTEVSLVPLGRGKIRRCRYLWRKTKNF